MCWVGLGPYWGIWGVIWGVSVRFRPPISKFTIKIFSIFQKIIEKIHCHIGNISYIY